MSEARHFVQGAGRYVDDITLPDMLYMAVVRSPYAHARVLSIEGGMNRTDLKTVLGGVGEGGGGRVNESLFHPAFAEGAVYYEGQPVAAVFADDRYEVLDKLDEVKVEYKPLKPVMTVEEALMSPPLHPETGSNIIREGWLGEDFIDPKTPVVLEDYFEMARVANNPMETRGLIADYDGSLLTVYISTQSVYSIRQGIASALELDEEKLRVVQADTGGAFGLKSAVYPEYVIACFAAMKFKRPVKWIESRSENLAASQPGRGVSGKIRIFARRDGRIEALRGEVSVDAGAFAGTAGSSSPFFIAKQITGPYGIKKAHVKASAVMTNKPPQGPYRGAGRPEAAFFMERMMDLLADELKMESDEVRLVNTTDDPFKSPLGLEIEASRPFFAKAAAALKYKEKSQAGKAGLGFFVLYPSVSLGESARIEVSGGKVGVWLGCNQHGQEHYVFVKKLLQEELDVPEYLIALNNGDTGKLADGVGAWGSRSAIVGGAALLAAARKLKILVRSKHGSYSPADMLKGHYASQVFEKEDVQLNSFGACLSTVGIDKFGMVQVKECAGCFDVGRALHPDMVESQIVGGMMQGIGQVLYESVVHNARGELETKNLFDAGLPTAENLPHVDIQIIENPSWMPHQARGVGESAAIGVPAALVRAIERVHGGRLNHTPIAPEELMA